MLDIALCERYEASLFSYAEFTIAKTNFCRQISTRINTRQDKAA
ncbi:hypothetical protein HMPREF0868_0857 [Mageeibacillus indolicus UPII9-5]|uniref:Uncharacterized protein n=1 Tax=Mageeibacillus indolicus (strain UPII9-5) TaxID=699246 RepID=D3R1W5_MAGIU|nr:hypothetical protein HMPREF0868_0857 [Mageeibacillus indolicus UPII9-5]